MKVNNLFLKGAAAVMLTVMAASCSNEEFGDLTKGNGAVTFSATLADAPQTRALADGRSAVNLKCAVYDQKGSLVTTADATFENLKTEVNLQLLSGETYDIVFFAYRDAEVYPFDTATGKMTVNYDKMALNGQSDDILDNDCFYLLKEDYVAGSSTQENVTLRRPVAQVNFGTNDINTTVVDKAYNNGIRTQISVDAYKTMNLLTGATEGEAENIVMPVTLINDALKAEAFPVDGGYSYLAMGYVLVPEDGSVSNITLGAFNGDATTSTNAIAIPNAPLKRNHRTNIYGSLLTSSSNWQIEIDNGWDGKYEISDYTDDAALAKGGIVKVDKPVAAISIPSTLDAPLTLNINSKVDKLTIGSISQPVTLKVAKDVEYPAISFERGSTVKGLTIIGDPTSDKAISGFDFFHNNSLSRPLMLEDLTLEGVMFLQRGFEPQYVVSTKNTVIRNCRFLDMKDAAIATQQEGGGGNETCEGLTLENCTIEIASDAAANVNGLYLLDLTGDVVLKGNTIRNAKYHGIFLTGLSGGDITNAVVTGNTITGALSDGVKVENVTGTINVSANTIDAKVNGIRLKNSVGTADVTVSDNTIDMVNAIAWDGSEEPSGILLKNAAENAGAKVIVKNNTMRNSNGHDFTAVRIKYAAGSDVATPFK